MAKKFERVEYRNKFGTEVKKWVPISHRVGGKVASKELKRAQEILKIDKSRIKHAERQLEKARERR